MYFYTLKYYSDCSLCRTRCEFFYIAIMLWSIKTENEPEILFLKMEKKLSCSQDGMDANLRATQ